MDHSGKSRVLYSDNAERSSFNKNLSTRNKIENQANIGNSGNSNVDVNVNIEIDTAAIAYAILCSSLARKELTKDEFDFALKKLEELMSVKQKNKSSSKDRLFRIW